MSTEDRALWEARASERGTQLNSVLFARFPKEMNAYVHRWHCGVIAREVLDGLPHSAQVLDLGCGYGRLGAWVRERRPDILLTGVDFTLDFCRYYAKFTDADVVCGDATQLPFSDRGFDAILAVTVLMYMQPDKAADVVGDLMRLVRPGGVILAIDPGAEFLRVARVLGGSSSSTGGTGFSSADYRRLSGSFPTRMGGMPGFSLCLPVMRLLRRLPHGHRLALSLARRLDDALPRQSGFTLHRWLRIEIPEST